MKVDSRCLTRHVGPATGGVTSSFQLHPPRSIFHGVGSFAIRRLRRRFALCELTPACAGASAAAAITGVRRVTVVVVLCGVFVAPPAAFDAVARGAASSSITAATIADRFG